MGEWFDDFDGGGFTATALSSGFMPLWYRFHPSSLEVEGVTILSSLRGGGVASAAGRLFGCGWVSNCPPPMASISGVVS